MSHVLPPWADVLRPGQEAAVKQAVDGLRDGYRVCFMEAPTGSGKSLIGDVVLQELDTNGLYVCSGLELQAQFHRDFPHHPLLMGRRNYRTINDEEQDCSACLGDACHLCPSRERCPYMMAKTAARDGRVAVFNTSYLLTEGNRTTSVFGGRGLVIADEGDLLEGELQKFIELRIGRRLFQSLKIKPPAERVHYETIRHLLVESVIPALTLRKRELTNVKAKEWVLDELRRVESALWNARIAVKNLTDGNWVRAKLAGGLLMKPVSVAEYAGRYLWARGDQWLVMSATLISPDQMAKDLGLQDHEWFSVGVPMTFPVENRIVNVSPVADMSRGGQERGSIPKVVAAIQALLTQHPDDRVLVHSVSYDLTVAIAEGLKGTDRTVFHYTDAGGRADAIEQYREVPGAVLVAPSLDRGVDFKDDDCRVVVVAKVPYPHLGDPQIAARLHADGGQEWYTVKTVRTLVQMTGRGVRSADDHATSYILDSQFLRLWRQSKHLFPGWWRDAVNPAYKIR